MATDGQFDPAHFGVYLIEALKDPQVQAAINRSIDHDKLNDNISIEVSKHIKILDDKIKRQGQEISDLKAQNLELQIRCTELEQYSRKNTLKIEGIQESPDENPFDTVLDVCDKLKLDPPIALTDIDNCHRVGRAPTDGRPRAIIVKFSSYRARKRVYDTRPLLADHNKRLRRAGSDDVFFQTPNSEAAEQPTSLEPPAEPSEQHTGRRPGSRATTRNSPPPTSKPTTDTEPSTDADTDFSAPHDDDADNPDMLISKWPIYINESLCKARSKLSFAARDLKRKNKISDTWTVDGRIKIRTNYNRIVNIETMADLEKYMWKSLNISKW